MAKVAIIYHSESGHTQAIAQSIEYGAQTSGAQTLLMACDKVDYAFLDEADAIVFGCPTYMGSISGQLKSFMDSTSDTWRQQKWKNKVAAGFTTSLALSGDKLSTLMQISLFAFQHGMIWVGLDLMAATPSKDTEEGLNRIGSWIGMMSQSQPGLSSSSPLSISNKKTAEYFGKRITLVAKKLSNKES